MMLPAREIDTVLIIDDDASMREALGSLIRSVGVQVQLFSSAQDFLQAAEPEGAACVVLDIRMPGLNGFECQRRLIEGGGHLPVIFMTGHGDIRPTGHKVRPKATRALPGDDSLTRTLSVVDAA
jgi:FixJ family two-component response regulator